jgi:hypothetical protein
MKCQVGEMSMGQNVKLTKCQVDEIQSSQITISQNVKLTKYHVDKTSSRQDVIAPKFVTLTGKKYLLDVLWVNAF